MSDITPETINRDTIAEALRKLGINAGDKVAMHSRLGSLGHVRVLAGLPNYGADALIDGLMDAVGPDGLLCLPTFTKTFASPASGPCGAVYDPDTTPSRVGSITKILLKRPERVRSLHPTHSWAALGARAQELVDGHETSTTFSRDTLCGRMYDWDFKVVWFGTTGTTNTSTHFPEDWLDLPYMATEDALVKDGNGWRKTPVFRAPSGSRGFYKNGGKLDQRLEEWNLQTEGFVHNAPVKVMRLRPFINLLLRALMKDPCLLLADGKEDAFHEQFYRLNVEHTHRFIARHGGEEGVMKALNCLQE